MDIASRFHKATVAMALGPIIAILLFSSLLYIRNGAGAVKAHQEPQNTIVL